MAKRASVPQNTFTRHTALDKLTGATEREEDHGPPAVEQRPTAEETAQETEKSAKVTFYLSSSQLEKLEDLSYTYRKRTGHKMNRIDIVRRLIDYCDIDLLVDLGEG